MLSLPKMPETAFHMPRDPSRLPEEEPVVSIWARVDYLWQRRVLILGATIAAAVVAALVTFTMPRRYRAEATIFLTPPTYKTTLRPGVMSVEAYAQLAETEHMLALVDARLKAKHADLFSSDQDAERGPFVSYSATLSASREPQKPYLPIIGLTAIANTPERARTAANAWADVFITEESKISAAGKSNSANFILGEYPKVEEALVSNENALRELLGTQARELAALKADVGVSLKTAQLDSYEWMVVQQEDALADARRRLGRLRPSVAQLEKEIASTPQYLIVSKAISDEALWRVQSQGGAAGDGDELGKAQLQSQEVNPVYVTLGQRLAEDRVNLNSLGPQIESLEKQLETMRAKAIEVRQSLLDGERRIAEMERRHKVEAGSLQRAVDASRYSFEMLAEKIGEARLAQSEPDKDLKLGAYAGLPSSPAGPRRTLIVAGATAAGFVLSVAGLLLLGLFRGYQRELQAGPREVAAPHV